MDINPDDKTTYTAQCQELFLKYVENEYCAKHGRMSVITPENDLGSNLFPSAKASRFDQSSFGPYDWSSNGEKYLTPKSMAGMTPGPSNCTARLLTATRLYLNLPPEAHKNWGKLIQILTITTPAACKLAVHIGYRISLTGALNKSKRTYSTLISPMWHSGYSPSYLMSLEWRPVLPMGKTFSAGESQKPLARPIGEMW